MGFSRRNFIATTAFGWLAFGLEAQVTKKTDGRPKETKTEAVQKKGNPPILVSSANGINGIDKGYEILRGGGDTLDAAIAVGKVQEDDPNDDSVGLGGLPNEEGVVELDSCCMHGPTRRAGSVAGVRWTKNPSLLAKAVMEHTGHVMLVGEGADRFARAMGFSKDELLTERSHKVWLLWKESNSQRDWWGPGLADPKYELPAGVEPPPKISELLEQRIKKLEVIAADLGIEPEYREQAIRRVLFPPTGTIHVSALNLKGEMSGMTTTSGLAWKLPGRAGDSPVIGAGCYTDQDVGSAGATGSGEENIKVAGAHTIVENMRKGMSPLEAGLDALRRIVRNYEQNPAKLRFVDMQYYILRKDGAYAGVSLWSGRADRPRRFAVHDGSKRLEECVALYQGQSLPFPPAPRTPFQRPEPVVK